MSALKPSRASSLSAAVVAGVVVTSSFVVPAQAVEPTPDAASATATTDLLYFNDFHGLSSTPFDPPAWATAASSKHGAALGRRQRAVRRG